MDDEARRRDDAHRQSLKVILERLDEIHKFVPTVLATEKRVTEHEGRLGNHERRIIKLEDKVFPHEGESARRARRTDYDPRVDDPSIPPPPLPMRDKLLTIDPDRTPTGGFKLDPEAWQKILSKFEEMEEQARKSTEHALWLKEQNDLREAKAKKFRDRVMFWLAVGTPLGTGVTALVTWLLSHWH